MTGRSCSSRHNSSERGADIVGHQVMTNSEGEPSPPHTFLLQGLIAIIEVGFAIHELPRVVF